MNKTDRLRNCLCFGLLAAAVTGCPVKRVITLRACAVEGVRDPQSLVASATERASQIWQQADIGFVALPEIPILPDPQPPGAKLEVPPHIALGAKGDIRLDDDRGYGSDENQAVVTACAEAWRSRGYPADPQPGLTVVFVRELISTVGQTIDDSGLSTEQFTTFQHNQSLCHPPYTIHGIDLAGRWSVVETFNYHEQRELESIAVVLAHELGHNLLLGHGDGLDDDGNGRWDQWCDPPEPDDIPTTPDPSKNPLMTGKPTTGYYISPLQAGRAGAVADALQAAGLAN